MTSNNKKLTNESLQENKKIEASIAFLQQEPTEEVLEPPKGDGKINLQAIQTSDGKQWWSAFTSFDEELKGSDKIMSTFTADIDKIFLSALQEPSIEGVIINPWNRTIMLNKTLISIILGKPV